MAKGAGMLAAVTTLVLMAGKDVAAAGWCGVEPHSNVCLSVLCKPDGSLGLFGTKIDTGGIDPVLHLQNGDYSVTAINERGPEPYPVEFRMPFPVETLDGLKRSGGAWFAYAGNTVKIPLQGSFYAITALEKSCIAPPKEDYTGRAVCGGCLVVIRRPD